MAFALHAGAIGCGGAVYGAGANTDEIPPRPLGTLYPNWEHMCVSVTTTTATEILNEAGAQGWELVGLTPGGLACFKRPVPVVSPLGRSESQFDER